MQEVARDGKVELRRERRIEVRAEAVLVLIVGPRDLVRNWRAGGVQAVTLEGRELENAHLVLALAGHKIAQSLAATLNVRAELAPVAGAERRRRWIGEWAVRAKAIGHAGTRRHDRHRALFIREGRRRSRRVAGDRIVQWIVAVILEEAPLGPTVPARGAGAALLRRDDDDAVRGIGAVQRRGRRSLHDLDVLDLVGADVVGAIRLRTAGEEVRRAGVARHAHPVDDVDRIVREAERVVAANTHAPAAARLRAAGDLHARGSRREHVLDVADRRRRNKVRCVDVADRVALFDAPLFARRRRHDFRELDDNR